MRVRALAAAAVMATVFASAQVGIGVGAPVPTATPSATLSLVAKEFLYEPKQLLGKAGEVTFTIKNTGSVEHDFAVEDAKGKMLAQVKSFAPGKTIQAKAKLNAGAYKVFCSIPGHREAGMEATLVVRP